MWVTPPQKPLARRFQPPAPALGHNYSIARSDRTKNGNSTAAQAIAMGKPSRYRSPSARRGGRVSLPKADAVPNGLESGAILQIVPCEKALRDVDSHGRGTFSERGGNAAQKLNPLTERNCLSSTVSLHTQVGADRKTAKNGPPRPPRS